MGRAISVDGTTGAVLVAGEFTGTISVGGIPLTSAGGKDVYVAQYNRDGTLGWAKRFGGAGDDYARGIDADPQGGLWLSGVFMGDVAFDGAALSSIGGDKDTFVARLNANGAVMWAKAFGGDGPDEGNEIEVGSDGHARIAGEFSGTITLGDNEFVSRGARDLFLGSLDADGNVEWATVAGGDAAAPGQLEIDDVNYAIAWDEVNQRIVSTGTFNRKDAYTKTARYPSGSANALTGAGKVDSYVWAVDMTRRVYPADGAFSSGGLFGFYPWIGPQKRLYGVVAHRAQTSSGATARATRCGQVIRRAFYTGQPVLQ